MTLNNTAISIELSAAARASFSEGVDASAAMAHAILCYFRVCIFVEHEKYLTKPLDPTQVMR